MMTEALRVKPRFTTDVPSSDLQSAHGSDTPTVVDGVGCRARVQFGDRLPAGTVFEETQFWRLKRRHIV
jgi:hypothetical protein